MTCGCASRVGVSSMRRRVAARGSAGDPRCRPWRTRAGELAFGTNFDITTFTKNILFDEKIGGTVHMALGAGYPETGSTNQSAIHWDLICDLRDGGSVEVDGEPFMRDGRYLV